MARFRMGEEDNYGNSGERTNFFTIKNDGEVKKIRFMYANSNDVEGLAVHEVNVNGKTRYVNCLRDYNSPIDDCPLCKAGYNQKAKVYVPVYDCYEEKVYIWERGKKFLSKLSSLFSRFPDMVAHEFEIERHGAPKSTDTTYEIYEVSHDNTKLTDLPEIPKVLGGFVLDKNAQEMEEYLKTGNFPNSNGGNNYNQSNVNGYVPQRRTPSNNRERF